LAKNADGNGYTCYEFDGVSCDNILTSIPSSLHATYAISVLVLFMALALAVLTCTAVYRPDYIDSSVTSTTATIVQPAGRGTGVIVAVTGPQDVYILDTASVNGDSSNRANAVNATAVKPTIISEANNPMNRPAV
jgi:hypothetical protein